MKTKVKVVQSNEKEKVVTVEVLAESIKAISEGIKKLRSGPLNDKCLVLLIQNAAPRLHGRRSYESVGKGEIEAVLDGIESLEKAYLK